MKKLLILALFLIPASLFATTYYVSSGIGSDSNTSTQAQSKTTPWAHLPGMANCTGACESYQPVAGDRFILRGGDSWTNSSFPVTWSWSGTSSSPIYIGVDQTWYVGNAWARPIFNAGAAPISGSNNVVKMCGSGNCSYVQLDNIEMKGLYSSGAGTYGGLNYVACYESCTYITLNHLYLHGWSVATDGNCMLVLGSTNSPYALGNVFSNGVIDGSDATGASPAGGTCYAFYGWPSVTNSVIHDLPNGILTLGGGTIAGNLIYNIKNSNAGVHENAIELLGGGGAYYIHDNVIHDDVGESFMFGNTGETEYIWNNLFYNLTGNPPHFPQNSGQTEINSYIWNNTVIPASGGSCFLWVSGFAGTWSNFALENNHCITTGSLYNSGFSVANFTAGNNVTQTPTIASGQGYAASSTYAYSPVSGGSTIGAGANIDSLWPSGYSTNDTNYSCTVGSGNVVVCPARTSVARPSSGVWDAGAYEFSAASTTPQPPSNMQVVVQ